MTKHLFAIAALALASTSMAADEWAVAGKFTLTYPTLTPAVAATSNIRMGVSSTGDIYFGAYSAGQLSAAVFKFTPAGAADLVTTPILTTVFDSGAVAVATNGFTGFCQGDTAGSMIACWDGNSYKKFNADNSVAYTVASTSRLSGVFKLSNGQYAMPNHFVSSSATTMNLYNPATGAVDGTITMPAPNPAVTSPHYRDWTARTNVTTGQTDEAFVAYGGLLYKSSIDVNAKTMTAPTPFTSGTFGNMGIANTGVYFNALSDELIFTNGTDMKVYVIDPSTAAIKQTLDVSAAGAAAGRDAVVVTLAGKQYMYVGGPGNMTVLVKNTAAVSDWSQF